MVDDLEIAMKASMYFWKVKTTRDGSNANAIADNEDIKKLTKLVNGGDNGLAERINYYNKAIKQL